MSDINPKLQKAINRVIALRQLAESAGKIGSMEEMDACLRRADEIFSEYRLDEALLESQGQKTNDPMVHEAIMFGIGKRQAWMSVILNALTKHYGGTYYTTQERDENGKSEVKYMVVARESDYQMMEFQFHCIINDGIKLADANVDSRGKKGPGARMSFLLGVGEGVASLFADIERAAREEAEVLEKLDGKKNAALVLLDNRGKDAEIALANQFKVKFGKGTPMYGGRDANMRQEGYKAGRTINISQTGLASGGANKLLK